MTDMAHPTDRAFVPTASSREGVSPVPASIPCANTCRGWSIHYDPPPIPLRQFDYQASDPNGDGEPNAYGRTAKDCRAEIDAILDERGEE